MKSSAGYRNSCGEKGSTNLSSQESPAVLAQQPEKYSRSSRASDVPSASPQGPGVTSVARHAGADDRFR